MVERKNRTVQEAARTMLNEAKLSDVFWKEAVGTAIHILNRGYLRANCDKTPFELWFGRTPSVKHFRVFGSKCYIKRVNDTLGKFDARSDEGIFLGYSPTKKAFRCYNLKTRKIVESADVKIDDLKIMKPKYQEVPSDVVDESDDDSVNMFENETDVLDSQKNQEDIEKEDYDVFEFGSPRRDGFESPREYTLAPSRQVQRDHPSDQIIGECSTGVKTRRHLLYQTETALLSHTEPSSIK